MRHGSIALSSSSGHHRIKWASFQDHILPLHTERGLYQHLGPGAVQEQGHHLRQLATLQECLQQHTNY
jgi:hypothetical protein